jgi:hypothetical protein
MVSRALRRKSLFGLALALAGGGACQARVATLQVERIDTSFGRFDDVRLSVDWPDGAESGAAEVRVAALDGGASGYRFRDLRWRCPLRWQREGQGFDCEGELRARGAGKARLAARWWQGKLDLELRGASGRLAVALGAGDGPGATVIAEALPVAWLQPLLQAGAPGRSLTSGTVAGRLEWAEEAGGSDRLGGPLALAGVGFDSADGRHAAAGLGLEGTLQLRFEPDATRVAFDGVLRGGEVLAGPLYVALPATPVQVGLDARGGADGAWDVSALRWSDPGVLELDATARIEPAAEDPLRNLQGEIALPDLARAQPRYLDALLGAAGLSGSRLAGAARADLTLRDGRWARAEATLDAVDAQDGADRFALQGLAGRIGWTDGEAALEGSVSWRGARLYGIALGPAELPWQSRERSLGLRAAAAVELLGGRLALSRLAWRPAVADRGAALDLALELQALDLARLSAALGWPAFRGTLSGRLPSARYADQVLSLEGGLQADLFDGRLAVDALALERPFGVAPTLTADLRFAALDLQPLTAAFGFGEITGRLDGAVLGLRLVDWSPVAFAADFHTTPAAKGPRRISRRAVNDLSRVGGGGLAAGLQNQVLKLFETFGYARIGLKCRLAENVCAMDGLDSSGPGYVIVEGSGLPRITVIGHQRQVDWPVLVARLKAATEGQVPIVQ